MKTNALSGLGTDAWIFNYGVGIGSTQVPNGVRLAVGGVQFTQNDLSVVRNISATGIITAANGFNASSSSDYEINGTSVLNSTTLGSGVVNSSLTSVGTLPTLNATNITNTNINSTGIHSAATYYIGATKVLDTVNSQVSLVGIATLDATTRATLERELAFAPNDFDSLTVAGVSTFNNNVHIPSSSVGIGTTNPLQRLQVGTANTLGINTTGTVFVVTSNADVGIGTTNPTAKLHVIGDSRFTGVINVSGISTLQTTTIIGGGTSTGTANQVLQVTGISSGAYIGGSLGIAITNPAQPLDVNGNVRFRAALVDNNGVTGAASSVLTAGTGGQLVWAPVVSGGGAAISGINVTQDDTGIRYPLLAAGTNGTTTAQYVDATALAYNTLTNCLGIGSTTPTSRLDIIGDIRVSGIVTAGDFNSSSDIKLKTNIQTIANPIEKVLQINGVSFNWKESGKATMGVIAQEVEAVLPELVSDTDPKSVNYNGLIGLLIECVKDQQRQINELRNIT